MYCTLTQIHLVLYSNLWSLDWLSFRCVVSAVSLGWTQPGVSSGWHVASILPCVLGWFFSSTFHSLVGDSGDFVCNVLLVWITFKKMEVPDFEAMNFTEEPEVPAYPLCEKWRDGSEGSVFHLANIFLFLGFMGGSGLYGLLYLFTFLTLGLFCSTMWAWSDPCSTDTFLWTFALFGVCLGQALHVSYRLRSVSFEKEFTELYGCMFKKLGVSLTHFGKIVACCEGDIHTIEKDHCFAIEGKTPIDKLSVLLSGRWISLTLTHQTPLTHSTTVWL